MCGIAGVFDLSGRREIPETQLARMNDAQVHRGPDSGGLYREPGVGLGHRRLSIIDLEGGQQPLLNEDGSVVVVFNGEIYNFPELFAELKATGHRFRTRSDTEAIVHGWEEWGEDCVNRFRGMFSFAVWDRNRDTLFLGRDRLGKKPLHYALLPDGQLVFGSELKSLLVHPDLTRTIDPRSVEEFLTFGYVPDPGTIFKGVWKLPPGHTLTVTRGAKSLPAPRQYWDVSFEPGHSLSAEEAGDEIIERLREATRIRLVSEVPLGAFLSGGVDSSAVVALMAGLSQEPVRTCAIAFSDPQFDESRFADMVARRYATDHHEHRVTPEDFQILDRLVDLYDEPYADSSAMPTYRVCELARRHVTVALSGDGGDECFGGYRRYRWHMHEERIRSALPLGLRRPLFGLLGRVYPKLDWAPRVFRAKTTFQALARDRDAAYLHTVSILTDEHRARLVSPSLRRELGGYSALEVFRRHAAQAPDDALARIQYLDFKTYLPGDILTKVDRASMAHGLEVRVPMLDHEFVSWVCRLPSSLKIRGHEGKWALKKALEPLLPRETLYREKMGFSVPLATWFRGPLKERMRDALLGPVLGDCGYFDMDTVRQWVEQHQSGRRDHSAALWSLLVFEGFLRRSSRA